MMLIQEIKRLLNLSTYDGLKMLAKIQGCHVETLSRLRRGVTKNPPHRLIVSLARHYGIKASDYDYESGNSAANFEGSKEDDS